MLKQNLSQKMLQKLSPQQIQLMKLLQIPTATLEQRIKEELEANPALEEGDDYDDVFDIEREAYGDNQEEKKNDDEPEFEFDDYLNQYLDDDPSSYKTQGDDYSDDEDKSLPVAVENTFHESLERQLGLLNIEEVDIVIAKQIIGSIDEDGYLRREPNAIVDDVLFSYNVDTSERKVLELIDVIQRFDPPGICARSLQECLELQLRDKMEKDPEAQKHERKIALLILQDYFEDFTKKH